MPQTDHRRRRLVFLGVSLLLYAIAYLPLLDAGFIWDDGDYVLNNPTLHDAHGLWRMWFEPGALPQYYPLVHTTFWIEYQLYGTNPLGYHLVNWVLHGGNALLVFLLLRRLGIRVAGLAALVFALHPVHVESVAWITERKNVLSGMFYLAAWLTWLRFETTRSTRVWTLAFALFVAALLSKSVTASLPAAILLLNWWRNGRVMRRDILALLPFFVAGIAFGLHTAWIEMYDLGGSGRGAAGGDWDLSIAERLLVVGRAFFFYPSKILWPSPLIFIYPRWELDAASVLQWLWPALALAGIAAVFVLRRRIGRGPLTAVLFHAGTLLPALGFLNVYPFRYSFVADHFQYLASLAAIVVAIDVLARIARHTPSWAIGLVLAIPLVSLSHRHVRHFEGLEQLWKSTIAENESCWMAHNNLGGIYLNRGDSAGAILHFEQALRFKPDHHDAKLSLGLVRLRKREFARAESLFREVIRDAPDFSPAWASLGVLHATRMEFVSAEACWRKALRIDAGDTPARQNLARLLQRRTRYAEALILLEEGIRRYPYDAMYHTQAAQCLLRLDRPNEAVRAARRALAIDPGQADASRIIREAGKH